MADHDFYDPSELCEITSIFKISDVATNLGWSSFYNSNFTMPYNIMHKVYDN